MVRLHGWVRRPLRQRLLLLLLLLLLLRRRRGSVGVILGAGAGAGAGAFTSLAVTGGATVSRRSGTDAAAAAAADVRRARLGLWGDLQPRGVGGVS